MKRKDFMKLGVMFVCFSLAAGVPVFAAEQQPADQQGSTQQTEGQQSGSQQSTGQQNTPQQTVSVAVSEADARKTALERVPGASEQDMRMELEFDDGSRGMIRKGSVIGFYETEPNAQD